MHTGIVCKIAEVFPIKLPNGTIADSIQRAIVCGYSVIVGKDQKVGDWGVFFLGGDIQLSEEFCKANNLLVIRDPDTGKKIGGGYIEEDRRVRTLKLLGVKSEGLFAPLSYFRHWLSENLGIFPFFEGEEFSTLYNVPMCNRFEHKNVKKVKENKRAAEKLRRKFSTDCFAQHQKTHHFLLNLSKIPLLSLLYVTIKMHGTSGRTGNVLVNIPNNTWITDILSRMFEWFKNKRIKDLIRKLHTKLSTYRQEYRLISGTRETIMRPDKPGGYYQDNFRQTVQKKYFEGKLRKGEVVYYEIVGFQENGKPIMQSQSVKKLKDKGMEAIYGSTMHYTYGCEPGQCDVYVYRITQVNEDGHAVELSWPQVRARCAELGLKTVPEACPIPMIYTGDEDVVRNYCDQFIDKQSSVDPRHIEEGVCIRIENGYNIQILKHKGFKFRALESSAKEDDSYEDMEEAS